ncbi:MAG: lipoate-protein ligase [Bryobacterales bacterium]|jgi:lipoyl(octanoyl) transferase|nr:lipoate-protein ligase [Bryobacterales bacterium]
MRRLAILDLGRMKHSDAFQVQQQLVEQRKSGQGTDTLLYVEHPHVVTVGRNGKNEHLLASPEILARTGIQLVETDRGGDVTYHGPGQVVGYPIIDLREWKRDVRAYFRAVEQSLIDALSALKVKAGRIPEPGYEGVWVDGAKIAAIGIHISRWVTSHGFALNVDTDLTYFKYIVPCGLTKPVCSLRSIGNQATRQQVQDAITDAFANVFDFQVEMAEQKLQETR